MRGEQMTGMRQKTAAFPAGGFEGGNHFCVFADAVREKWIELHEIAARLQPCVAQQIARVVEREQIFPGGKRCLGHAGIGFEEIKIEGRRGLFDPLETEWLERPEPALA